MTSTDGAVRALGRRWKPLQRMVYLAALLTAAHWLLEGGVGPALVHFVPLLLLQGRIRRRASGGRPTEEV